MGRWTDIAQWVGPTSNMTPGAMVEWRGVVIHIAEGTYDGTISWQRNPDSDVSSHFIVAKDGRICQMVDTADKAWTQRTGNGHWLSIENEGRTPGALTTAQVAANAAILAKAHRVYGVPLQVCTSPTGMGLGHHSMGAESGFDWGHSACPGASIIAQKPAIVAAAKALITPQEDGMADINQDDWTALIWRTEAIASGRDTVAGGPTKGQPVPLVAQVRALTTAVAAVRSEMPPPVDEDALVDRVVEQLATRLPTAEDIALALMRQLLPQQTPAGT